MLEPLLDFLPKGSEELACGLVYVATDDGPHRSWEQTDPLGKERISVEI